MLRGQTVSWDDRDRCPRPTGSHVTISGLSPALHPSILQCLPSQGTALGLNSQPLCPLSPSLHSFPPSPWPCFSSPNWSPILPPSLPPPSGPFTYSHSCSAHSWLPDPGEQCHWALLSSLLCSGISGLCLQLPLGLFLPGQELLTFKPVCVCT